MGLCPVTFDADDLAGSASTLVYPTSDTLLKGMWGAFDLAHRVPPVPAFSHNDGSGGHSFDRSRVKLQPFPSLPRSLLTGLHTIRVRLPQGAREFKALREIMSAGCGITRVDWFVERWRARMK